MHPANIVRTAWIAAFVVLGIGSAFIFYGAHVGTCDTHAAGVNILSVIVGAIAGVLGTSYGTRAPSTPPTASPRAGSGMPSATPTSDATDNHS